MITWLRKLIKLKKIRNGWQLVLHNADEAHIIPVWDNIPHYTENCICGPEVTPVFRDDGSNGWVVRHHSLDGRERYE